MRRNRVPARAMTSRWSLAHSSIAATRQIDDQGIEVIVNRNAAAPDSLLAQPGQAANDGLTSRPPTPPQPRRRVQHPSPWCASALPNRTGAIAIVLVSCKKNSPPKRVSMLPQCRVFTTRAAR